MDEIPNKIPTVEDYDSLDPEEHVLLRPSTYIGSITKDERDRYFR